MKTVKPILGLIVVVLFTTGTSLAQNEPSQSNGENQAQIKGQEQGNGQSCPRRLDRNCQVASAEVRSGTVRQMGCKNFNSGSASEEATGCRMAQRNVKSKPTSSGCGMQGRQGRTQAAKM